MKKAFGILAIASVVSFALMGCTPQAEGDTAPAPNATTNTSTDVKPGTTTAEPTPTAPATK